jgi:hypothetical protein
LMASIGIGITGGMVEVEMKDVLEMEWCFI